MNEEERLINEFYGNLQARNWKGMTQLYHPDIFFYDPVFGNLEGPQVSAMWEMLLSGATELDLQFSDVKGGDGYASCRWTATYPFPPTGRKVTNHGRAMFRIEEGKIVEHQDEFLFWRWSAQALGWKGRLFGRTTIFQNKVRRRALRRLEGFMKK
ncbi:MAG TPA: nuclear transport factor 2 family protein [Puia sp.]|nr:nuclear transport factor 2 family protein [Puia sp.]